jgi:uncharacterized repeat protein (TIGR01451 family)
VRGFTSLGAGRIVRSRRIRRVSAIGITTLLVALASPLLSSVVSANSTLDAVTEIDCDPNEDYNSDAVDLALATALKADGYKCTALLNKGQLSKDKFDDKVGELWQKKVGTELRMRTIIFGDANTGLTGAKACLDDDTDPINNVAPGGTEASYCLGSDGATTVAHGASGGPTYPPAPLAGAQEEAAGKFELMVDNLVEIVAGGGFDVNIDGYTEVVVHFNKLIGGSDTSIVAYFQPATATTTTTPQDETPTIDVTKTANTPTIAEPGGSVTFTVEVTNTSTTETVTITSLSDNPYGAVTCPGGLPTLAPGAKATCSVTGTVSGNAGDTRTDTVTAQGEDDDGDTASDTASATVTITNVPPTITVDKSASASTVRTGSQVTYTYVVTTAGPESLVNVTVVDDKCSPVTFVRGDTDTGSDLDPGESWTYTCTTALTSNTVNTATATGSDDDGSTVTDTDTASVTVIDPRIAIDKSADPKSTNPGGRVTYTYLVTNPGVGELSDVVLTDDKCSPVSFVSGDTDGDSKLDTGETWRYTCVITAGAGAGALTNVATVTAKDPTGGSVSATDTETITVVEAVFLEQQPSVPGAVEQVRVAGADLPATGQDSRLWLSIGMGMILIGLMLQVPTRRRRSI